MNESLLVGALAEYMVKEQGVERSIDLDSTKLRNIGEEVIADKINKIFEELKADDQEFEASYKGLSASKKEGILATGKKEPASAQKSVRIQEEAKEMEEDLPQPQRPSTLP